MDLRIQVGEALRIVAEFVDGLGEGVGSLSPTATIQRVSDGQYYKSDFSGYQSGSSTHSLSAVTGQTGAYVTGSITTTNMSEEDHYVRVIPNSATPFNRFVSGKLIVGRWVDNLDQATSAVGLAAASITAAKFAAGAIDAAAIAADAIGSSELAASAANKIRDAILSDATAFAGADIATIKGRLPTTLVSGRIDASVGAMASDVVTATAIAADAIGSSELAASAVNEIRDSILSDATPFAGADIATLISRLSAARAGYLDNLNVGGNVASSAEATAIQNNTRVVRVVPAVIERPDSGTETRRVELLLYDSAGNMEAPDSAPTITLVNQAGTDRSSRLDSTTMALVSTGRYRAIYTADAADALEQLVWVFSVVEGGATRLYGNESAVVDTTAVDFTSADRTKLNRLDADYTTARAGYLDNINHAVAAPGDAMDLVADAVDSNAVAASGVTEIQSGLATASAVSGVQTDVDDLQVRLPATLSGGRMRSQVEGMDANTVTAAAVAADAIGASELAADAVTEIASAVGAPSAAAVAAAILAADFGGGSSITMAQGMRILVDATSAGDIDTTVDVTGWVMRIRRRTTGADGSVVEDLPLYDQVGDRITNSHNPMTDPGAVMIAKAVRS